MTILVQNSGMVNMLMLLVMMTNKLMVVLSCVNIAMCVRCRGLIGLGSPGSA